MPNPIAAGFKGHVEVIGQDSKSLFKKEITNPQELKDFLDQYSMPSEGWGLLRSAVCPLHTKEFTLFLKDITLPTFIHFAMQVDNLALKILASIFAIAFDVITLPVRLIATPFRAYYSHYHPELIHPLLQFLTKETGRQIPDVWVEIRHHTQEVKILSEKREKGDLYQEVSKEVADGSKSVSIRRSHALFGSEKTTNGTSQFIAKNGIEPIGGFFDSKSKNQRSHFAL